MDNDVQIIFAGRKARIFNERYRRGDAVMHQLTPGGVAQFDRVYGAAFVQNGESVVELAGRAGVVPTDRLFAPPPEPAPRPTGWAHSRAQLAALLLAFTLGGASVVLLAVSTDPRRGADCDAPAAELPTYHGGTQV